jgi:hypothetical protein
VSAISPIPTSNEATHPKLRRLTATAPWLKRRAVRTPPDELPAPDVFDHIEREPDRICQLPAGIK